MAFYTHLICVTKEVPVFQRIMDRFIEKNSLKGAEPFSNDVYIGGETKEAHDLNLICFLDALAQENITPNMDNCAFGTQQLNVLRHISEGGSKTVDPEQIRVLIEYPDPVRMSQLKRLLHFFTYYAKGVVQYSAKVRLLLPLRRHYLSNRQLGNRSL